MSAQPEEETVPSNLRAIDQWFDRACYSGLLGFLTTLSIAHLSFSHPQLFPAHAVLVIVMMTWRAGRDEIKMEVVHALKYSYSLGFLVGLALGWLWTQGAQQHLWVFGISLLIVVAWMIARWILRRRLARRP